jgi:hypothetical protein
MKKLIIMSVISYLGLTHYAIAEERSIQETVEATDTATDTSGYQPTVQGNKSTAAADNESRISKGGLFLEPMLTGSREDSTIRTAQLPFVNSDTSGNLTGYGVGLRLGAHVSEILLLAADARYSKMQMDDSFYRKADTEVYNIAPMIGLQTPLFGIRVMAGYVVAGENNPAAGAQGVDLKFKEATGWRVGAGLYIFAVSVNLEYQDLTYNTTEVESFGSIAVDRATSIDANSRGYTLSLGFPIAM